MQQQLIPARALPPGRILQKELQARDWTYADLEAIKPEISEIVTQIIQGNQHITPEIAEELSLVFGNSAQSWINLENNYRLYLAKKFVPRVIDTPNY
ncbi:MAG: transcriptional regulator [Cyanobacteria bacterium P01_D01_bin.50]